MPNNILYVENITQNELENTEAYSRFRLIFLWLV